jgi:phospholipid/cholesterol/gamma-HCH transport system permease protein
VTPRTPTSRTVAVSGPWRWSLEPVADSVVLRLAGSWRLQDHLPSPMAVETELASTASARRLGFDTREVTAWDSGLLVFVLNMLAAATSRGLAVDRSGLPDGVRKLLDLAAAVPERDTRRAGAPPSLLARVGASAVSTLAGAREMITFVGEASLALGHAAVGRARFRRVDLLLNIQEAGASALGIVSLISFLIGLILAFVGAVQLRQFGAQIYIADLVAIGMAREMGAMMAAIIMAGRTGAAYAAQLGTMRVNEEIDALSTMGISPFEFLVLPRMLGLILMMPLLTVYANLVGIAGGAVVGIGMLKVGVIPYWNHTWAAVSLDDFAAGLIKSVVFGVLIAIAGCMRGMQSGRSSAAVGLAATSAVVTGIVFIIVSDAVLTVVYDAIGF